jgi:hypothetical protein
LLPVVLFAGIASAAAPASADCGACDELPKLQILSKSPPPRGAPPAGVSLVANSLSPRQLQRLAASLRALSAVQARRSNPFYVSLDDGEERAQLQGLLGDLGPMFTAAAALAAGRWQSAEGDVILRPVQRCPAGARCVSLLAEPGDALEQRVHFLAWPLGYAVILRAKSSEAASQIAERLRDHANSTQIALVLTRDSLHRVRRDPAATDTLKQVSILAARLLRREPSLPFADVLAHLAAVGSTRDELPWLDLLKDAILVVPRLGSLATSDRFVAEVRVGLRDARVEWIRSPR